MPGKVKGGNEEGSGGHAKRSFPALLQKPGTWLWWRPGTTPRERGETFTSRHYVMVLQRGARLMVRSLPASESQLSMDLSVNGQVITGTWTEQTKGDGYYRGAVYHGALQMLEQENGRLLDGRWVGFGKEGEINDGAWSLALVDEHVDAGAVEQWNQTPA
jgi:hypothetical protein